MSWLYLVLAVVTETVGTTFMKLSDGLKKPLFSLLMLALYGLSLGLVTLAIKRIEVSVAYAIWSGAGTAHRLVGCFTKRAIYVNPALAVSECRAVRSTSSLADSPLTFEEPSQPDNSEEYKRLCQDMPPFPRYVPRRHPTCPSPAALSEHPCQDVVVAECRCPSVMAGHWK